MVFLIKNIIEAIPDFIDQITDLKNNVQSKLDGMVEPKFDSQLEKFEEVQSRRENQVEILESLIDALQEADELVNEYNSQYRGLKGVK